MLFSALLARMLPPEASATEYVGGFVIGNVYDGDRTVPGTVLTLEGPPGTLQEQTSNEYGAFRFAVSAGTYTLRAEKEGFGTVTFTNVVVEKYTNTAIAVELRVGADQVITRPMSNVTKEFLAHITSGRGPSTATPTDATPAR